MRELCKSVMPIESGKSVNLLSMTLRTVKRVILPIDSGNFVNSLFPKLTSIKRVIKTNSSGIEVKAQPSSVKTSRETNFPIAGGKVI